MPIASYPNVDQFWPFTLEEIESFKYGYKESKGSLTDCAQAVGQEVGEVAAGIGPGPAWA